MFNNDLHVTCHKKWKVDQSSRIFVGPGQSSSLMELQVGEHIFDIECATPPVVLHQHRIPCMPDARGSARIKDPFHYVDVEDSIFGAGPLSFGSWR
jgi:hypothetical protein